jgi:hypothetical protein
VPLSDPDRGELKALTWPDVDIELAAERYDDVLALLELATAV